MSLADLCVEKDKTIRALQDKLAATKVSFSEWLRRKLESNPELLREYVAATTELNEEVLTYLREKLAVAEARCDDIEKGRNFLLSEVIRLKEVIRVKNERSFDE